MLNSMIAIFCIGAVFSFYLNNKKEIDKTRSDLENLLED